MSGAPCRVGLLLAALWLQHAALLACSGLRLQEDAEDIKDDVRDMSSLRDQPVSDSTVDLLHAMSDPDDTELGQHAVPEALHLEHASPLQKASFQQSFLETTAGTAATLVHLLLSSARSSAQAQSADPLLVPTAAAAGIFACLCAIGVAVFMLSDPMPAKKLEEVRQKHSSLYKTYGVEVGKFEAHVQTLGSETSALVERTFREKQKSMEKSLSDILKDSSPLLGAPGALVDLYRRWFLAWLEIFSQCSLDPAGAPHYICSEAQLREADTVKSMAELLVQRSKDAPVHLIAGRTGGLQYTSALIDEAGAGGKAGAGGSLSFASSGVGVAVRKEPEALDNGDPFPADVGLVCLKVTLFSWAHAKAMVGIMVGIVLALCFLVMQQFLAAGLALVGCLLLVIPCMYVQGIDERIYAERRLKMETQELEAKRAELEKRRCDVDAAFSQMQALKILWTYQTVPRLENFEELVDLVKDVPDQKKQEFMHGLVARLDRLSAGMGKLSLWIDGKILEESKLALYAQQLGACTSALSKHRYDLNNPSHIFKRLDTFCGFLTVRIIACYDLPNKSTGFFSAGYVNIHVLTQVEESTQNFKTKPILNDLNPRWAAKQGPYREQYFMPVTPDSQRFQLQVWGDTGAEEQTRFGFLLKPFRDKPGAWHRKVERLYNMKTKQPRDQGDIEYEFFFASSVEMMRVMLSS